MGIRFFSVWPDFSICDPVFLTCDLNFYFRLIQPFEGAPYALHKYIIPRLMKLFRETNILIDDDSVRNYPRGGWQNGNSYGAIFQVTASIESVGKPWKEDRSIEKRRKEGLGKEPLRVASTSLRISKYGEIKSYITGPIERSGVIPILSHIYSLRLLLYSNLLCLYLKWLSDSVRRLTGSFPIILHLLVSI